MFSEINEVALSLLFFFDTYAAQISCPSHLRVCPQTAYYIYDKDTGIAKQSNIKHVIKVSYIYATLRYHPKGYILTV